ncbi:HAMP domain-containing protein [Halomonas sp. MCCC 1A11036]|uniref:HAMP domain-containing protein n=1 Tax=Billgrantia zhangzhouensis TaxID=2733481 RepID=A0ABS9A9Z2_9GAMM|nr:methyl-accepting chemotaxis protein [Halomonas zhangzhouensis]MCE8018712.1 HAMP domain-containing protein [Halomonas zhangzhouensis]
MGNILRNLSVKASLTVALIVMAAMSMAISGLGFYASGENGKQTAQIHSLGIEEGLSLNRAINRVSVANSWLRAYRAALRNGDQAEAARLKAEIEGVLERADESFQGFMAVPKQTAEGEQMAQHLQQSYMAAYDELLALLAEGLSVSSEEYTDRVAPVMETLIRASGAFADQVHEVVEQVEAEAAATDRLLFTLSVMMLVLIVVVALVVYFGLIRGVVKPLEEVVGYFANIAKLDLTHTIPERGTNEIGKLFSAMRNMQQGLVESTFKVQEASDSISIGSNEIATGNADLSSRTEQQAASLEETASSMEELTSTVSQNADNARQATQLAADASVTAVRGGDVMQEVSVRMQDIANSSTKIADITSMIDSIAFQTNILALNASVEAARAGEQGRGFAVVASEVRTLASRSADAAKEIKGLIEASTVQVQQGTELVDSANVTIQEVVQAVKRVSDIMDEISAASQEQSDGIGQVNQAVAQMDQVTQQNASLVQEISSAAASLAEQAKRLDGVVRTFRLPENDGLRHQPAFVSRAESPQVANSAVGGNTDVKRLPSPAYRQAMEDWEEF